MICTPVEKSPHVGRFARSIETGWRGCVVAVELHDGEEMLRMKHGYRADDLEDDDVQWFATADVRFLPSDATVIRAWWAEYLCVLRGPNAVGNMDQLNKITDECVLRGIIKLGSPMTRAGAEDLARECDEARKAIRL